MAIISVQTWSWMPFQRQLNRSQNEKIRGYFYRLHVLLQLLKKHMHRNYSRDELSSMSGNKKIKLFFQFQPENWLTISSFLSIQCDHVSHWHDSQEGLVKTSGQEKEGTESCSALKKRTGLWHDLLKWLSINFGQRGSTRNKTQGCPTILSDLREKNYVLL